MDSTKIYEEACDIVDTLLRQGKTSEEIYVEYRNELSEEYEKESDKRNCETMDLYNGITAIMADRLAKEAVRKAGYRMMEGKRFYFWVKAEGGKTCDRTD